jgi:hypothetical protein
MKSRSRCTARSVAETNGGEAGNESSSAFDLVLQAESYFFGMKKSTKKRRK